MKRGILKIIVLTIIYVCVSLAVYFVLDALGLASISKIRKLVGGAGAWGFVLFFIFQIIISTFICVIPFEDEVLTSVALMLFGPVKGFLIASFNMFVTSSLQFWMGRTLGKDVVTKFLGEDSLNKYERYLNVKGEMMLPILYLVPLLPHDSLCVLAGMSNMKYIYFAPVTLLMRSLEIASICFLGSGLINFSALSMVDWVMLINLVVVDAYLVRKLYRHLDKKINSNNTDVEE